VQFLSNRIHRIFPNTTSLSKSTSHDFSKWLPATRTSDYLRRSTCPWRTHSNST